MVTLAFVIGLTGGILVLNLCAAGVVALAHVWRRGWSHRRRVGIAALLAGAIPMVAVSGAWIGDLGAGSRAPAGVIIGLLVVMLIFAVFSLPLAFVLSRKLGSNQPIGDTFS